MPYQLLADAVLLLHALVVLFVVGGLVLVVAGNLAGWPWVNRPWFRGAHLLAIAIVVAESWLGMSCPLTTLETWLRMQAGIVAPGQGFIEYWVQRALFYEAPGWVFAVVYSVYGLLIAAAWWYFPPKRKRRDHARDA